MGVRDIQYPYPRRFGWHWVTNSLKKPTETSDTTVARRGSLVESADIFNNKLL